MHDYLILPKQFERAVLDREGRFRLETEAIPKLGRGDLLFRLISAGLTPEDVTSAMYVNRTPPAIPIGEIAALGDGAGGWNPLDRAVLLRPPLRPDVEGAQGLAEYVHVPQAVVAMDLLVKIPQEIPAEDATLIPAAALAARVLRTAAMPTGGRLVVLGCGLVGQIVILMARHQRAERIFAVDVSPTLRRKAEWAGATRVIRVPDESVAKTVGAELHGSGAHAVVALVPDGAMLHEAMGALGRGGSLVLGAPFPSSLLMGFSPARLQNRELRLQGVNGIGAQDIRDGIQAVRLGIVNGENLVSKRVPWTDLPETELTPEYWIDGTHVVVEAPEEDEDSIGDS